MESRKWEDLKRDCLVKVLVKVGVEALIKSVSLVCKPWYNTCLDPLCWRYLDLRYLQLPTIAPKKYIESIVDRSCGTAIRVTFPQICFLNEFVPISEGCPLLKFATLPDSVCDGKNKEHEIIIPQLVSKWKQLELLNLSAEFYFEEIITQVGIHCKNFVGLVVSRHVETKHASAIVNSVPKIKSLKLKEWTNISPESLILVLAGCKELEEVDVSNCFGFDSGDDKILKAANHIKHFRAEGSKCRNDELLDMIDEGLSSADVLGIANSIAEI